MPNNFGATSPQNKNSGFKAFQLLLSKFRKHFSRFGIGGWAKSSAIKAALAWILVIEFMISALLFPAVFKSGATLSASRRTRSSLKHPAKVPNEFSKLVTHPSHSNAARIAPKFIGPISRSICPHKEGFG